MRLPSGWLKAPPARVSISLHPERPLRGQELGVDRPAADVPCLWWRPSCRSQSARASTRRSDTTEKQTLPGSCFRLGLVPEDLSEALRSLNQVRKDATYEGEDPNLDAEDLEVLSEQIEAIVVAAEERAQ